MLVEVARVLPASPGATAHEPHVVCFFHDQKFPARRIAEYLARGLELNGAALAFATPARLELLVAELRDVGIDVAAKRATGQLVLDDAESIARAIGNGGSIDASAFQELIVTPLERSLGKHGAARVYGEIVDVMCRAGSPELALQLERAWCGFISDSPIGLLCGYTLESFASHDSLMAFRDICAEHAHVEPALDGWDQSARASVPSFERRWCRSTTRRSARGAR